jgi:hypothetical protein
MRSKHYWWIHNQEWRLGIEVSSASGKVHWVRKIDVVSLRWADENGEWHPCRGWTPR